MTKAKVLLFFVIVFFFSCGSDKKKEVPTVLLAEDQMVDVLTDVQLMEGIISFKKNANQKTAYIKEIGFDTLFAHHGINDSIFKVNMSYYNEVEPNTLIRILDSVGVRLARMKN